MMKMEMDHFIANSECPTTTKNMTVMIWTNLDISCWRRIAVASLS